MNKGEIVGFYDHKKDDYKQKLKSDEEPLLIKTIFAP